MSPEYIKAAKPLQEIIDAKDDWFFAPTDEKYNAAVRQLDGLADTFMPPEIKDMVADLRSKFPGGPKAAPQGSTAGFSAKLIQ